MIKESAAQWLMAVYPFVGGVSGKPFNKGSFTYYVISRGGGGFQMLTVDYGGGGGGGGGVWSLIT